MLLAALQASTQNSRRTNIKWLKNEGPTKIVSSSVTENRTGTLGLNRRFAYKLSEYQGGGSRWPTRCKLRRGD